MEKTKLVNTFVGITSEGNKVVITAKTIEGWNGLLAELRAHNYISDNELGAFVNKQYNLGYDANIFDYDIAGDDFLDENCAWEVNKLVKNMSNRELTEALLGSIEMSDQFKEANLYYGPEDLH